jgi:hypothetical protein
VSPDQLDQVGRVAIQYIFEFRDVQINIQVLLTKYVYKTATGSVIVSVPHKLESSKRVSVGKTATDAGGIDLNGLIRFRIVGTVDIDEQGFAGASPHFQHKRCCRS